MEGKALLFKYLGGVDDLITACEWIEPTFGGINLKDIEKPKCFYVLDKAREQLDIPAWHDDQQGTATVILAGLINALRVVGKKLDEALIAIIGIGAANTRTAIVLMRAGAKPTPKTEREVFRKR